MAALARSFAHNAHCYSNERRLPYPTGAMFTKAQGAHGRFFVSDPLRLAYLDVPRAASTTLRGFMREAGGHYRRLQALFNNSAALRFDELSAVQRGYFTFTFVAEPVHHVVDGWTFVQNGPDAAHNISDMRWHRYLHDLAAAPRRSAEYLRSRLFFNPHLLPQASYLQQMDATGSRVRLDFIGRVGHNFDPDFDELVATLRQRADSHDPMRTGELIPSSLGPPAVRRRSSSERTASLLAAVAALPADALAAICRIRYQEFACLGWPLPDVCHADRDRLARTTGWLF